MFIFSAQAAPVSSPPTAPVIGRAPTATGLTITNASAAGKNPAQGDLLKATYTYADPDDDLEDPAKTVLSWLAEGTAISGATTDTFTPVAAQNKKFLSFSVTPGSMPPADPDKATAPLVSPDTGAPVLPPRAQLANEYTARATPLSWGDAYMHCAGLNARLPTNAELQTLFVTYTRANAVGEASFGDIANTYGWGNNVHWANTGDDTRHEYVYIHDDGRQVNNFNENTYPFACAKFGTPELLPSVTGVSIPAPTLGSPVTATYTYNGNPTIPNRSRFQWHTATESNGTTGKTAIKGATASSYTPVTADVGKWLVVEVTPASYSSVVGPPVSAVSAQVIQTMLTDLSIEKPTSARASFQANYTFTGGTEQGTTYQWYWKGQAVSGATSRNFTFSSPTIPSASEAEELAVEVTPRNSQNEEGSIERSTLGLLSSLAWNAPSGVVSTWYEASKYCASQLNNNKRPGTLAELQGLYAALGNLTAYGVPTNYAYWTGTSPSTGHHNAYTMSSGAVWDFSNTPSGGAMAMAFCVAGSESAGTWPDAFGRMYVNDYLFPSSPSTAFNPTNGHDNAYFVMHDLQNRTDITYRTSDSSIAALDSESGSALVTLKKKGRVNIEVYNSRGGNPAVWTIDPARWWYEDDLEIWSRTSANCKQPWQLINDGHTRRNGYLYGEWGPLQKYGWTAGPNDRFHTQDGAIEADLYRGEINVAGDNNSMRYRACIKP